MKIRVDGVRVQIVNERVQYLGSRVKIKIMFKALLKEGFSQDVLDKIHAPLGLFIKSETPEEIAVSIAAQLIKVKNTA